MNGVATEQSGFPYSFSNTGTNTTLFNAGNGLTNNWGAGVARPDILPGCNLKPSGSYLSQYNNFNFFNKGCIVPAGTTSPTATQNPQQQMLFGDAPRNTDAIRSQFLDNFDFALSKSTKIWETSSLLFRAEFFNLFNHPVFGNANAALAAAPISTTEQAWLTTKGWFSSACA